MMTFLIIVAAGCGGFVFLGIPLALLWRMRQNRKLVFGHVLGGIVDRTGTTLQLKVLTKDREICRDEKAIWNEKEKTWDPFDYIATEGFTPNTIYPPFGGKLTQVSMPFCLWVEGIAEPPDVLGQYRSLAKVKAVDSSQLWAHMQDEKASKYMMKDTESWGQMIDQLEAMMKKRGSQIIILLGLVVVIVAVIIMAVMLNGKIAHMNETLTNFVGNLTGVLPTP